MNLTGLGKNPKGLSFKNYTKLDNKNPDENFLDMETIAKYLSQEYIEYKRDFNLLSLSKRFDTNKCSKERFMELSKDPRTKSTLFYKRTVDEPRAALHAEIEGIIDNVENVLMYPD